jgi:hypothetical protein
VQSRASWPPARPGLPRPPATAQGDPAGGAPHVTSRWTSIGALAGYTSFTDDTKDWQLYAIWDLGSDAEGLSPTPTRRGWTLTVELTHRK